ncbi:hypothetical protein BDN70DRAFT_878383 [Pholiota conissans]|uniref:Uncharacterized protein n=1 Tax=Pholiota conissans TaxID=109636 RepID=A0A9P5Z1N5_9AGAR|nr:hypothetical protein BDN70DRAFT_878383 [Pholiota conissans]
MIDWNTLNGSDATVIDASSLVLFSLHCLPSEVVHPPDEDIIDVMKKLDSSRGLIGLHPCFKLEDGRFVKSGASNLNAALEEARVTDFIRVHTKIPVPTVHTVFAQEEYSPYVVMDHIPGENHL